MLKRPVTIMRERNLGTTRFLTGSTPSTWSASSSSRILRAPRSAVIAVPATPARITAVTKGANSRTLASTKKPPSRSSEPNRIRKLPAWRPGAPYPNATVDISSGNQHNRSANRNWITNSPPYGYGGLSADMIVLPVKIIMSPTCSNRFLVGKNARSATARTTWVSSREHECACERSRLRVRSVRHRRVGVQLGTVARGGWNLRQPSNGRCKLRRTLGETALHARFAALVGVSALAVAGCGGEKQQDAQETSANFPVKVVSASFPEKQSLAKDSTMEIVVQNAGREKIPTISVTVKCKAGL